MTIKQFVPLAVVVVGGLSYGANKVGVPVPPVFLISTFAAILLVLQLEDQKLGDLLSDFIRAFKNEHHA